MFYISYASIAIGTIVATLILVKEPIHAALVLIGSWLFTTATFLAFRERDRKYEGQPVNHHYRETRRQ